MIHRLRMISGLVMFAFLAMHLADVSLALISIDLMDRAQKILIMPWQTLPGSILLLMAFLVHAGLAFRSLYVRGLLRLPRRELLQLALGLLIPALLAFHLMQTRIAYHLWEVEGWPSSELLLFWTIAPGWALPQGLLILVAWGHGCIGLHGWLRLQSWYSAWQTTAFGLFIVVSTLAVAGYVSGGLQVRASALDQGPDYIEQLRARWGLTVEVYDSVVRGTVVVVAVYFGLVWATLALRKSRMSAHVGRRRPVMTYDFRMTFQFSSGRTALDAIRDAGIPHASICGGNGRCSTCRVRVSRGAESLEAPAPHEQWVLERISAPPDVRLACQIRPVADIEITPLLPPSVGTESVLVQSGRAQGEERELAILFCDLRGFTQIASTRLPYDVVFILNRFFDAVGGVIEASGGRVDQFIGDGVMALFGLEGGATAACRGALRASCGIVTKLTELNESLSGVLDTPLRIGMGLNVGQVIVGEMGYKASKHRTAIGDPVNVASRLEELAKKLDAELVAAREVFDRAGLDPDALENRSVELRGHGRRLEVCIVPSVASLDGGWPRS